MIRKSLIPLLLLITTLTLVSSGAMAYEIIGQPSIFWREGEWQVYKDGHWMPYAESKPRAQVETAEPEKIVVSAPAPDPALTDTNAYYYDGGYGYSVPLWGYGGHRHTSHHRIPRMQAPQNLNNRSIGNIGRTTIGIGQPTIGIGPQTSFIGPQPGR